MEQGALARSHAADHPDELARLDRKAGDRQAEGVLLGGTHVAKGGSLL